ncbi:helix-turn-helix domain-containing protein [Marinobacterium jannaschii]|uniref:helix-turn-helix domain-containing protein n=1 Tax=Marinobacterium jannaschii TaxID=64970 RepID=UPI00068469E1|nr:XRE family transcriptional regulator [Marinobacterium jannaschii]
MTLGQVIRRIRHAKQWTLQRTCEEVDFQIQPGHLSRIERGEGIPSIHFVNIISKALGVSIDAIMEEVEGKRPVKVSTTEPIPYLPIVSWVQAGSWTDSPPAADPLSCDDWVIAPKKLPKNCYALRVVGDSMTAPYGPSFPDGCIIIVDPTKQPENKSFVVARQEGSDEATFKQLAIEGGTRYLKPLNQQYPLIQINGDTRFCGVVTFIISQI